MLSLIEVSELIVVVGMTVAFATCFSFASSWLVLIGLELIPNHPFHILVRAGVDDVTSCTDICLYVCGYYQSVGYPFGQAVRLFPLLDEALSYRVEYLTRCIRSHTSNLEHLFHHALQEDRPNNYNALSIAQSCKSHHASVLI